ncbi:PAS domain S-box protein [Nocardia barduliensis]|uniref:PAS domain S-box protein n=1 Tax=Nocardia barduliensis TaxID=2736643 RepID=UPI001573A049|nr:PAS domain S-box protein [Nocardia barduliensis]
MAGQAPSLDYEDLLARLVDVVYVLDTQGCFLYLNRAGTELFGRSLEDLIGHHLSTVVAPDALQTALDHFHRGIANPGTNPYFETRILRPDGEIRELEIHAGSVLRDGHVIGRQGIGRDITEIKRLQTELADKTSRLALIEDQQRAAMDIYHRLSFLSSQVSHQPHNLERVLDIVEDTFRTDAARSAGMDDTDIAIIELVADGYSNQEIADRVHLSVHTIKDRVGRIITRLDARSRAGVATRAMAAGLLPAHRSEPR